MPNQNNNFVIIREEIVEDAVAALKEVYNTPNATIKPSQIPALILAIPRYILGNYTNSDNVTNATLKAVLDSVKSDTSSLVNNLSFTDVNDAEDIIDDVIGGS